jgi:diacylglycerol kinase family enzyme
MKIGKRVYVLNAGVGISAAVIGGTTSKNKSRFGRLAYLGTAFKILRFRPRALAVTVDGKTRQYRAVEVAISNCGILAKALYPKGPDIRPDDGHLDIWILSMKTFGDYARYFFGIIVGRRANLKAQFLVAEKSVTITSRADLTTQADGDVIGRTPLEVEVLPSALTILAPESFPG